MIRYVLKGLYKRIQTLEINRDVTRRRLIYKLILCDINVRKWPEKIMITKLIN